RFPSINSPTPRPAVMHTSSKPGAAERTMTGAPVADFIRHHFRHFNSAALVDAAEAYRSHIERGEKMMITLAGAMSTAELGLSLAEMIRRDAVRASTCAGGSVGGRRSSRVAHDGYERTPAYRELSGRREQDLLKRHRSRVTDTCIPEMEARRRL